MVTNNEIDVICWKESLKMGDHWEIDCSARIWNPQRQPSSFVLMEETEPQST